MKTHDCFKDMPAKTSQQTIIKLGQNWTSFLMSIKDYSKNPTKYTGRPKIPKFLDKNGRYIASFDYMQAKIKNNMLYISYYDMYLPMLNINSEFRLLRIIPIGSCYKIEIVYKKEAPELVEGSKFIGIDLGINNFATITNNIGLQPIVINGKILKSKNNYYNKIRAKALSYIGKGSSKRLDRIDLKRNNIISTHLHRISRYVINYCLENNISKIIIGRNKDWQRGCNIGKKNNQRFVQIPFEKFINQLTYKGEEHGIEVIITDERYTSKSSFIDNDILPKEFGEYDFNGKRVKRGLYKSNNGTIINADVNGSYNIIRKCIPEFIYNDGIKGVSLYPIKVNIN